MTSRILLTFATLAIAGLPACKSAVEKCMETTDETYKRQVAACADDACKKKAEKDKLDYYEACKNAK